MYITVCQYIDHYNRPVIKIHYLDLSESVLIFFSNLIALFEGGIAIF